ncbi:MAG: type I methionyl aminopeptidase [Clostridia bacterium]|nr:type I methionyl aminopeptidase [Clostridia bacterium]
MIIIKNLSEIELMRKSGELLAEVLLLLEDAVKPGVSTADLDNLAEKFITGHGAYPTFKGYAGFPAAICASVNEELLHGIPSKRKILREGDIISIDAGVNYKGLNTDAARTFAVGKISEDAERIIQVTEESFFRGLPHALVGNRLYDISARIGQHIERNGFKVVTDYVGHGVGRELHEDPSIPNYGKPGTGIRLRAGMTLAVEPMVTTRSHQVKVLDDGWTVVARDGLYSAHYENTILLTEEGPEILTLKEKS